MKITQNIRNGLKTWSICISSFGDIVLCQLVFSAILSLLLTLLRKLAMAALASTGRVAVTTGDFLFIFTTWQGILLLLFGLVSLYLYVVADINTKIVFANKLLKSEKYNLFTLVKGSLMTLPRFFNAGGALIVLFVSLLAPLTGVGLYISLTRNLKIPTFITSVIQSNGLYRIIYFVVMTVLLVVAVLHIFSIFAILIDDVKPKEAFALSRRLMTQNWKLYLKQTAIYILTTVISGIVAAGLVIVLLWVITSLFEEILIQRERLFLVFLMLMLAAGLSVFNFVGSFCYIVRMSRMYYDYQDRENEIPFEPRQRSGFFFVLANLVIVAFLLISSYVIDACFDTVFTNKIPVLVIAHRAGGSEAPENSVSGIEKAALLGAYGSEIDIQRTSDGYYVVNHDSTFERLCGVNKKPEEMTLAEIRNLVISDPLYPGAKVPVATFEDMLEAAKGKIILFTELKGATADRQMVDDAVALIRQYGMEEECVLISLKYDVIDYAEDNYPDIKTAYLMFASFGDVASLNCDFLGLEEESTTPSAVQAIHNQNKKVLVWTPNSVSSQRYFLLSDVDAIITDNVSQANGIIEELRNRSDIQILIDFIADLIF
jgi:glycerophosphoryl diester phosphodiesterase